MESETPSILAAIHKYQLGITFALLGALGHVLSKLKSEGYDGFWVSFAAGLNAFIIGFICLVVTEIFYSLQIASVAGIFGAYLGGESIHILMRLFRAKTGVNIEKETYEK
jgi:hypothetical protein